MHRLERMYPIPYSDICLCLAVSTHRGKAVVGSDHKLLEAITRKACGSTSTSIKHSDVPVDICYCGYIQTKRKYIPYWFLGQMVSGRGKQLEGGIFRRKLILFHLSSICGVRNVEPSHARCSAVPGQPIAFQWYSGCPSRRQQLWDTWVLGIRTKFVHFGKMYFANSEERKIKKHDVTLYFWQL